uniref:Polynucleotidyl transferase, Ribonuclease H fold n=1 Tax=Medicago truncatula TaxID=3880 RepID=Q2HRT1_MEDTR|nr:Polynucleotidyl transferase, Ribonuclease H fold [Medicago truncatula]
MCLSHETWPVTRINLHIQNTINVIQSTFHTTSVPQPDRLVRWNNNNFDCVVLNVDGSCLGSPIRAGYGGIFRNSADLFLSGFSGYLASTSDILMTELTAIHHGMLLAMDLGIDDMVCHSDSLLSIQLLTEHVSPYHTYAVLIQDIKNLPQS